MYQVLPYEMMKCHNITIILTCQQYETKKQNSFAVPSVHLFNILSDIDIRGI